MVDVYGKLVGKHTIHGCYGIENMVKIRKLIDQFQEDCILIWLMILLLCFVLTLANCRSQENIKVRGLYMLQL